MRPEDILLVLDADGSEDPIFLLDVITPDGVLQVLGEIEIRATDIVVRNLHIGGDAEVRWGWSRLRRLGRLVAEKLNVDCIEIRGAVRTTGANPGRRPGTVRLFRPSESQQPAWREHP